MNKLFYLSLWILSFSLFILGITFPLILTKKQILGITFSSENITLLSSIKHFIEQQQFFLASVIIFFTFFLPILKYFYQLNIIFTIFEASKKTTKLMALLDKWSMLDVFLVALLLLVFKMDSQLVVMKLKIGTLFLAGSIVLRMILSNLILRNNYK